MTPASLKAAQLATAVSGVDTPNASAASVPPRGTGIIMKIEVWDEERLMDVKMVQVAWDASDEEWEAAVRRLGMKLGAVIDAYRRRQRP